MPEVPHAPSQRMLSDAADHRNASTSPLPATIDRPGAVGLRGHSGGQRLPERRGLGPLALGQLEQPPPVSPRVALRRQRPGSSLPNRTGCEHLLRAFAAVGALLVAFRPFGVGYRPHAQGRPDHRHRHQRSLPQLRHPRGLAHPPGHSERLLDGPHRGTAQGTGPSRSRGK